MLEQRGSEDLRSLEFMTALPDPVLKKLAPIAVVRDIPAQTIIFKEGTAFPDFSLIASGEVSIEMNVPGRGKLHILTLGAGDALGWTPLIGRGPMTATATALDVVRLLTWDGATLRRLCESDHQVGYHVLRQLASALSRRLLATRLQLLDLFADTPPPVDPLLPVESSAISPL